MIGLGINIHSKIMQSGGAPPWSPIDLFIGNQGFWIDFQDTSKLFQDSTGLTPVTATGQPIGLVVDKSPNGNNFSQSTTTKRPIYTTITRSGIPTAHADFDGGDDSLDSGTSSFGGVFDMFQTTLTEFSFLVVYSGAVNGTIFARAGTTLRPIQIFNSSTGQSPTLSMRGATKVLNYGQASGDVFFNLLTSNGPSAMRHYVNVSNPLRDTASSFGISTQADDPTERFFIGCRSNTNAFFLNGEVYEMLAINKVLTTDDFDLLETYLINKHGPLL